MKSMNTTESENGQLNANQINNYDSNYEKFSSIDIENTPFTIITDNEENKHFGCMGNHRLTEQYENIEELKTELKTITWNKIIQVIIILTNTKIPN